VQLALRTRDYLGVLGLIKWSLKNERGLPDKSNLRYDRNVMQEDVPLFIQRQE
jgi:hypothetical protein